MPWRKTRDPYRILVSEVMLQQTRVSAVIPYYERFLLRFPDAQALAEASEEELLRFWSGLGYYSRARNLQKAAREIVARGEFPRDLEGIRALAGVGEYTAAAVASIAFDLPEAAVDGNVLRVIARLDNDGSDIGSAKVRKRFGERAAELLDRRQAGMFNQAMMELGATLCVPRQPKCLRCPLKKECAGREAGTAGELPVKLRRVETVRQERILLYVERKGRVLLRQRGPDAGKLAGFWELPEAGQITAIVDGEPEAEFRHSITNHIFLFRVQRATLSQGRKPRGFEWLGEDRLITVPLSTATRKALAGLGKSIEGGAD